VIPRFESCQQILRHPSCQFLTNHLNVGWHLGLKIIKQQKSCSCWDNTRARRNHYEPPGSEQRFFAGAGAVRAPSTVPTMAQNQRHYHPCKLFFTQNITINLIQLLPSWWCALILVWRLGESGVGKRCDIMQPKREWWRVDLKIPRDTNTTTSQVEPFIGSNILILCTWAPLELYWLRIVFSAAIRIMLCFLLTRAKTHIFSLVYCCFLQKKIHHTWENHVVQR